MTPNRSLEQPNLTSDKRGPANDSSLSPSAAPFAESADSCDSLVLIRLNRDVTSPSFRFDSRADVNLTHRTGRVGREEGRGNEGTNHHRPTAYRRRTAYVTYDRVTGVTEAVRESVPIRLGIEPPRVFSK